MQMFETEEQERQYEEIMNDEPRRKARALLSNFVDDGKPSEPVPTMTTGKLAACMSSNSDEWGTPPDFFAFVNKTNAFTLDVCATAENAKCPTFYTKAQDGLRQPWNGRIWCNPPYSKNQALDWFQKGLHEINYNPKCELVAYLIPARTDTKLWHHFIIKAASLIYFIEGRLSFTQPSRARLNPAPFPSCLIILLKTTLAGQPHFISLSHSQWHNFKKEQRSIDLT